MVVMVRFASLSMAARCRQKNENQHKERRDTWDSKKKKEEHEEKDPESTMRFSRALQTAQVAASG
jgi:hypothetical protein